MKGTFISISLWPTARLLSEIVASVASKSAGPGQRRGFRPVRTAGSARGRRTGALQPAAVVTAVVLSLNLGHAMLYSVQASLIPELFGTRRLSEFLVSHLSDNVIMLSYYQDQGQVKRALSVIKTRASGHDPAMREFSVGPAGVTINDQLTVNEQSAISRENGMERS